MHVGIRTVSLSPYKIFFAAMGQNDQCQNTLVILHSTGIVKPLPPKPTKIHGLDYKLGLGHQEEDGISPNLHTFESRAQLSQILTGIMGPLGRQG